MPNPSGCSHFYSDVTPVAADPLGAVLDSLLDVHPQERAWMSLVSAGSCPHLGLNLISSLWPSEAPVNVLENRIWQPGRSIQTHSLCEESHQGWCLWWRYLVRLFDYSGDSWGPRSIVMICLQFVISTCSINADIMITYMLACSYFQEIWRPHLVSLVGFGLVTVWTLWPTDSLARVCVTHPQTACNELHPKRAHAHKVTVKSTIALLPRPETVGLKPTRDGRSSHISNL